MTARKPNLSPASLARADRQRLAAEEGARAMAEVEREALAVRKNMERLRALREARDAEAASDATPASSAPRPKLTRRVKRIVRYTNGPKD
ncbi:hypothetical protein MTX26_02425 [Bradyrhizobium sp. ISRA443]|uniref:hypothetical protein n=1 Tax=unclassified Bradyrhizobium TaxID=2631580 RepID=UPI00247A12DB|nr:MULTISPECIES: hypothetical protein [unclassified Bradyrhizobium]WGR94891.1 hypothetical protein MTX20_12470 [Bradyrhizobium sp. ISRA435]WGR99750.1 hypothetical protein MTX23_02425 [Bradyrhizobium sp. ISRA436]WGS06640.1 hypothetical protein MTX18_02425 [Bradyrhizobium sp. ISRA437]WGS13524.1 hypothetical protein MTX26_02425 [Bradyrhizobium sp. ISRA443]